MIELTDLYRQYQSIEDEIYVAITTCIRNSSFIGGDVVKVFEKQFAEFVGSRYCIAVGNGTDALEIIFNALNIKDKEVILPAMTAAPTVEAVVRSGNTPVFCDVDSRCVLDLQKAKHLMNKNSVLLPVHLYGAPVDMTKLLEIAHGATVIEDCAQAHGTAHHGKHVGNFGIAGAFSFYPSKNLGAYGDAGAIVTNDEEVYQNCVAIRNHGRQGKFDHAIVGRNSRMDGIQASILSVKLKHLNRWLAMRTRNALKYREAFADFMPLWDYDNGEVYSYHQFPIFVENREHVQEELKKRSIATGFHYPFILPELAPYKRYAKGVYPCAKYISERELSIPVHEMLNDADVDYIIKSVLEVVRG